jgi:nitrite reductase (NADH) small subunit
VTRHIVGSVSEIPPGTVRIVKVQNPQGVGVFNVNGSFYALKNVCPHQGGPLCQGPITGTTRATFTQGRAPELEWIRDGEIVRCPWHRWEFDIATGKTIFESRMRVANYNVRVENIEQLSVEERTRLGIPPDAERVTVYQEDGLVILEF